MLKEKTINVGKELFILKKQEIEKKYELKRELDDLAEEMADILDLKNKDGETDPKQIKIPLLKEAFLIKYEEKNNTIQEKADILELYLDQIDNDEINPYIEKISKLEQVLKDNKIEKNAIKKEIELTEAEYNQLEDLYSDEKEWIKFINLIVKEKSQQIEEKEKEKYLNEKDKEVKDPIIIKELFDKEEIKQKIGN